VIFEPKEKDKMPNAKVMNADGKVIEAIVYKYDEEGRLLQELIESTARGFKRIDTHYTYDEQGRLVIEETIDHNGVIRKRIDRMYDESGMVISEHLHEENPEYGSYYDLTTEFEYTFF
jgi:antitoxin component YwqK of YwqJK toxin-antitoxin module